MGPRRYLERRLINRCSRNDREKVDIPGDTNAKAGKIVSAIVITLSAGTSTSRGCLLFNSTSPGEDGVFHSCSSDSYSSRLISSS